MYTFFKYIVRYEIGYRYKKMDMGIVLKILPICKFTTFISDIFFDIH